MREIPPDEADKKHGITAFHSEMDNGEFRFRLKSRPDSTAYIRTESGPIGAWQESHKHLYLPETYIVQSGWIGYVETENGTPVFRVYREGELFTTPREVIHNVYLPTGAVIHTVKHGKGVGEDRIVTSETKALDDHLKGVSEAELLRKASSHPGSPIAPPNPGRPLYSDAYKHFDNLIWQVPAWTTAIAAIVFAGLTQIDRNNVFVGLAGLDTASAVAVACGLFGLFLLGLGYALFRFRRHQVEAKTHVPDHPLRSPQVYLQLLVNVQAAILLLLAILAVGIPPLAGLVLAFSLVVVIAVYQERIIISDGRGGGNATFKPS